MKWFKKGEWVERLKDGYRNMPKAHRREFIEESWQQHLRLEYELALEFHGVDGKPWDELSQDDKDSVEITVKQHAADMQEFGKSLSTGDTDKIEEAGRKLTGIVSK